MILCEITANHVTLGLRGTNDKFLNVREAACVWNCTVMLMRFEVMTSAYCDCVCVCWLQHDLSSAVVVKESYWMLGACCILLNTLGECVEEATDCVALLRADQGELTINLQKMKKGLMWPSVFVGHGEVSANENRTLITALLRLFLLSLSC